MPNFLNKIKDLASEHGLVFLGTVPLAQEPEFIRFESWLARGYAAEMSYLHENKQIRQDPRLLLTGAKTAIVVGLPYFLGDTLATREARSGRPSAAKNHHPPRIAQYARLKDYHRVLWRKGAEILAGVLEMGPPGGVGRVVVDSAPILERALAVRGSKGFIGKNTCFIDSEQGSFFLLGEILTSFELPLTENGRENSQSPTRDGGCGSCRRCQTHCPTGALDEAYQLDARKCLSYWTIEHRGPIPTAFWPWLRLYYYGCDICQLACPFNRQAGKATAPADLVRISEPPDLFTVATMSQAEYERLFGGTPMTRAKRPGLMRNALIAMTVTGDSRLNDAIILASERADGDATIAATIAQIRSYQPW